ncbi:hypothetical protein ACQ4PT_050988 [Festuca glaucescens]
MNRHHPLASSVGRRGRLPPQLHRATARAHPPATRTTTRGRLPTTKRRMNTKGNTGPLQLMISQGLSLMSSKMDCTKIQRFLFEAQKFSGAYVHSSQKMKAIHAVPSIGSAMNLKFSIFFYAKLSFIMLSFSVNNVGTIDCSNECRCYSMNLLQFIGLKITGYHHAQPESAKIFGFFATQDQLEPLHNYVYRREIDNYEAVTVKPKTHHIKSL